MRIGMPLSYSDTGRFKQTVDELADYESAGLDIVFVAEAYSYDGVSQLGYIAAKTERLEIASGIFNIYSRTPTLLAMTAADRKSTRLNSSHLVISYAVFCLKKKNTN